MNPRARLESAWKALAVVPLLLPALALLIATPAPAQPRAEMVEVGPAGLVPPLGEGSAACLFSSGTAAGAALFFPNPNPLQQVYMLVQPSDCPDCPAPQALLLRDLYLGLSWAYATCPPPRNFTIEVSVVGAGSSAGCLVPDPARVLCGPELRTLTQTTASIQTHTIPMPDDCCVGEPAFIRVRFVENVCPDTSPALLVTQEPCQSCQVYFELYDEPGVHDWCAPRAALWYQVRADCCMATPTLGRSWGGLKSLYR
jgi:hypothetical protein